MPWIKEEDCKGCGKCVKICPEKAITIIDSKAVINQELCKKCKSI